VTVDGHDREDALYAAVEEFGHGLPDYGWKDLLAEKNIGGWEFHASLRLGEVGHAFLRVEHFLDGAD
jgi:hypothetical protein